MRSLYWKIFLSFWLVTGLVLVASTWVTHEVATRTTGADEARAPGAIRAIARVRDIEAGIRRGDWSFLGEPPGGARVRIVGPDGEEVGAAPRAGAPAGGARDGDRPRSPAGKVLHSTVTDPSGTAYRIVAELPPERPPGGRARSGGAGRVHFLLAPLVGPRPVRSLWWVRIGVALLVSGALCFVLARYLAAPLTHLRDATRSLAAGNLSTRVGDGLGARRDEIGELGSDFDTMASRIEALVGAQRRLLRDVSHELRSPLARLQVALELARMRAEGRAGAEHDRIELETERLGELIGQILTLERLSHEEAGALEEHVDPRELLEEIAAQARFESSDGDRDVRVSVAFDGEIAADPESLRSAFENVVRNAVRHTAEGTAVEVTLDVAPEDRRFCRVRVRDHGPGVPEESLGHLFEPFFRVDDARSPGRGGYGLGLSIAERVVRRHGGRIEASNASGGGLVMEIRLPIAVPA